MAKSQKAVGALECNVQIQFYLKVLPYISLSLLFSAEVSFFLIHIMAKNHLLLKFYF